MKWTQEQVDAHQAKVRRQKNEANIPLSTTNVEQGTGDESLATQKAQGFDGPACIHIHSFRKRLTDADGACSKYLIDAIVDAGILPDDKAQYVKEVTHSQEKTKGPEITEVTIS